MDTEIKAKWVAALRSGDYKQGGGSLYNTKENTFCCLGVLLDVVDPEGWITSTELHRQHRQTSGPGVISDPENFGLTEEAVDILMGMNDGMDSNGYSVPYKTFKEIADWIEENIQ